MTRIRRIAAWCGKRWPIALALVLGVAIGLAVPLAMTLFRIGKTAATFQLRGDIPSSGPGLDNALYQSVGARLAPGHSIELLDNGSVFDAITAEIAKAKRSVHIVMYIWEDGVVSKRIVAALVERAKAGVACRIVIDAFGSSKFDEKLEPELVAGGCEVRTFRPLPGVAPLARNHRKLVIVDGATAITGGFGIRDNWLGDGITGWRDSNVKVTGPSVRDVQQAFAENWQEAGGSVLPAEEFPDLPATGTVRAAFVASGAAPVVTSAERLTQLVIAAAKKRLWIANAYFAPSPAILDLLIRKRAAGVDVRLIVPGIKSDSKPALAKQHQLYPKLREAGIRVWEYDPSMIHSKTMLADDELVVIGTINLDPLSLDKLEEAAVVIEDKAIAVELAKDFEQDVTHATAK